MSLITRLLASSKAALGHPFSREDIYAFCEKDIRQPPILTEWREVFSRPFAEVKGAAVTLEDYYRDLLRLSLDEIAAAPTREKQRQTCIHEVLAQMSWYTWLVCYEAAKTDVGQTLIDGKLAKLWPDKTPAARKHLLVQFYIMNATVQAVLVALGIGLLGIPKEIELQIGLCREYEKEISMLEVSILDCIGNLDDKDPETAKAVAQWSDNYVGPTITRMLHLLDATKKRIVLGTFDVVEFEAEAKKFDSERSRLRSALVQVNFPNLTALLNGAVALGLD